MLKGLNLPGPRGSLPYPIAYALGAALETTFYALKRKKEPPVTRYAVVKMGKTHTYSNKRAQKELGYQSKVLVDEGLENVYAWIDKHGMPKSIG
jgi:nucleoside-diphosphate-sugar epimerase